MAEHRERIEIDATVPSLNGLRSTSRTKPSSSSCTRSWAIEGQEELEQYIVVENGDRQCVAFEEYRDALDALRRVRR